MAEGGLKVAHVWRSHALPCCQVVSPWSAAGRTRVGVRSVGPVPVSCVRVVPGLPVGAAAGLGVEGGTQGRELVLDLLYLLEQRHFRAQRTQRVVGGLAAFGQPALRGVHFVEVLLGLGAQRVSSGPGTVFDLLGASVGGG